MTGHAQVIRLDVRGEICPEPLFKARDAMRKAQAGQEIEVVTDFSPAVLTVTNAAFKEGWDVHVRRTGEKEWVLRLSRSAFAAGPR